MKRTVKVFLCAALAFMMLFFSSCRWLEELRDRHAVWTDEQQSEIRWKDEVYRKLPDQKGENYSFSTGMIYITEADVPLFVASAVGTSAYVGYRDQTILYTSYSDQDGMIVHRYARSDIYEDYKKAMEEASRDHYCMMATLYDPDSGESKTVFAPADPETSQMLDEAFGSGNAAMTDEETDVFYSRYYSDFNNEEYHYTGEIVIYRCDAEMLIMDEIGSIDAYQTDDGGEAWLLSQLGENYVTRQYVLKDAKLFLRIMDCLYRAE